jgi:hypothetical protein
LALKELLKSGGLEVERDVQIVELPGAQSRVTYPLASSPPGHWKREIDGFWANAMGGETATSSGAGKFSSTCAAATSGGDSFLYVRWHGNHR